MQDSSLNHLPQMHTLASMRNSPFMEIDDKGGEIVQRYESLEIKIVQWGKIRYKLDMNMDKEGAILEKRRIKILGQKKHTSWGSKLMNFD